MAQPFAWDELARFAFAVLRLTPEEFWRLTPRELAMALSAFGTQAQPLERAELNQLMGQFPDEG
ncbi:MAG: rcc01693 family protein [Rhizobiaceae bacterium]